MMRADRSGPSSPWQTRFRGGGLAMPRWLMKFDVEAHVCLPHSLKRWRFNHPTGLYEVVLVNHDVRPAVAKPLLYAYITYEAEDIGAAQDAGARFLTRFLDYLSFATGSRFSVQHRLALFDWSPGAKTRRGRVYRSFPDPNIPTPLLHQELADSLRPFISADPGDDVLRALHWFALGVSGSPTDEQFQFFWFAIETLAVEIRDTSRFPDECPRCHTRLHCPECSETPTHRPYPTHL